MSSNKLFDAVIFDLDGVITKTALVHSAAWKLMFDAFLKAHAEQTGTAFVPFDHKSDYLPFVDGKPRYKGVADFLASRSIELPFGDPDDKADMLTVCGLGNRKNQAFNEVLDRDGVEVYPSTVALMKTLRQNGYRVGVASSSKNCEGVLRAAGLLDLVETRIDGVVSAEIGLKGKPEADIFTTAADRLDSCYARSIVVEDAVSGVAAGKNGRFGLVLGVAREENQVELYENGADWVVDDLQEVTIEDLNHWFSTGVEADSWSITYHGYHPAKERSREALLAIGNGYFGVRGAMEESSANAINYPGTYMAGMYNRLITKIADRDVENEDFVNMPNWLPVNFKVDDGEWFDPNRLKIISLKRRIDLRNALLEREMLVEDDQGHQTLVRSKRLASLENNLLAAICYELEPINYDGTISLRSGIDGQIINAGVDRYKTLSSKHLEPVKQGEEEGRIYVVVKTNQSEHQIAEVAKHQLFLNAKIIDAQEAFEISESRVFTAFKQEVKAGDKLRLEKTVAICSDKEHFVDDALSSAFAAVKTESSFDNLFQDNQARWAELWDRTDIVVAGDRWSQKLLRLHIFHLLVSVSPFNRQLDASITARGLHGEAYRGHIFWDELFILPFYDLHLPEVAKSLLMYRHRRLPEARKYAAMHGYSGAMFPWQSGSDGREETQVVHLNPLTGKWGDDNSSLQRHVSLAIAYNVWDYFWITNDEAFLKKYGAGLFFEICRFWASKAQWNEQTERYHIAEVMGPDEFHEHLPGTEKGGLTDNAYTNIMVAWIFGKAMEIKKIIGNLKAVLPDFEEAEVLQWQQIASKLNLEINTEGIIAQFAGYFDLQELDWDAYTRKYDNIHRMDRILKAEGKSPDAYKLAKQADTLMTFYNLNKEEVDGLLQKMGYQLSEDYLKRNMEYYLQRTSHGSTLSRVVHARLAATIGDEALSWSLYQDALSSDYNDIQGGTTGEGIHAGVMAGTVLIALNTFAGINYRKQFLRLEPALPKAWKSLAFKLTFKQTDFAFEISHQEVRVMANKNTTICVNNINHQLVGKEWTIISLKL
ncbi:MAG: HAD family hydrolase [Bacteroidetes bacterium]|jgi:HAD superfamily hydrolase (TIGR01509 family)|nr:HAD family hydrolase [Bacteroidota bacterium]